MLACTKCGYWHTNAERSLGRNLSCTEVKKFWNRVKEKHRNRYGHPAMITMDGNGTQICFTCKREILSDETSVGVVTWQK